MKHLRPSLLLALAATGIIGCGGGSDSSDDQPSVDWTAQRAVILQDAVARETTPKSTATAIADSLVAAGKAAEDDGDLAAAGRRFGAALANDIATYQFTDDVAMIRRFAAWAKVGKLPEAACVAAVPVVVEAFAPLVAIDHMTKGDVRSATRGMNEVCGVTSKVEIVELESTRPAQPDTTVRSASYTLAGTATPGSTVTIDGARVPVPDSGRWSYRLSLESGENDVEVGASKPGMEDAKDEYLTFTRKP